MGNPSQDEEIAPPDWAKTNGHAFPCVLRRTRLFITRTLVHLGFDRFPPSGPLRSAEADVERKTGRGW